MAARPAWSLPPSPCGRYCAAGAGLLRRAVGLSRGCCAAAAPSCAAPSRGRGVSCWGSLRLQSRLLRRGLCALGAVLLAGCALLPCYVWARKARPRGCLSRLAAAPCYVWAHIALRLCFRPLSCPLPLAAAVRYRSPAAKPYQKHIKSALKCVKKPAFCAAHCRKHPRMRQQTVR